LIFKEANLKQDRLFVLLFMVVWLVTVLWLNSSNTSLDDLWHRAKVLPASIDFGPSGWWIAGLGLGLFAAALPFLFGWALDGKGQGASGWLLMFGAIASLCLGALFLIVYFGAALLAFLANLIFG
jgi:hypothetical protein